MVARKASREDKLKLTYYFSSIVPQLLKLSTICKSPLHGSRNYVDRTWERSANYSARTLLTAELQLMSSSSERWIHSVRSIVADCVGLFFWISEGNEILFEIRKKFETVVGEGDKHGVCDKCRYRVEKSWKSGKAIQEQLLKRK